MDTKTKKDLVVLDNSLITAAYNFTLNEQRLIWCAMKQIPKGIPIEPNTPFLIRREDFIELGADPKNVAREIRQATRDLLKRTVKFLTPIGEVEIPWLYEILRFDKKAEERLRERYPNKEDYSEYLNKLKLFNLIDSVSMQKHNDDDIVARVIFHEKMLPLLSDLKARFTPILFSDVKEFSSFNTYRFYELFMQYLNEETGNGWVQIEIEKLKYMLVLSDKYRLFADFKKRVIDPSVNEINEQSSLLVQYDLIKKGRKFSAIKFTYQRKKTVPTEVKEPTENSDKTPDLFDGLTDLKRETIQARIDEYIEQKESKGEIVSDFHRKNITKKAVDERWGLDVLVKKQRKKQKNEEKKSLEKAWNEVPKYTKFRHKTDGSIWQKEAGYLRNIENSRVVPDGQVINFLPYLTMILDESESEF